MASKLQIIEVTGHDGSVVDPDWLARAERVHRQLREDLPKDYARKLRSVFAGGGRMAVAVRDGQVVGVTIWRVYETTFAGLQLYVDDLVTDEKQRSTGVGKALLRWLDHRARERQCRTLALDSGTQRRRAHAFYFREGLPITSFHFAKKLG